MKKRAKQDKPQLNPDWVEPKDGEIVGVIMTREGAFKEVYDAKTKQVVRLPYLFGECYPEAIE